jgi:hypothetical protein
MTLTFMRPAIAVALALSLAACGGGKASFPIAGTVAGLKYAGLVLSTNGMDLEVKPLSTSFLFPNQLSYGEVYNVVAKTQPAHQTCTIGSFLDANGKVLNSATDTAGRLASINIGVACALNTAAVGGTITGLTSLGLQLTNGSTGGTTAPLADATTFTLPNLVAFGVTYGVTVLAQPAKEICRVSSNGNGEMADAAVTNIVVTCVPKPA